MARKRKWSIFHPFGSTTRKKRRAGGAARRMKAAPAACKTGLSKCMTGGGRGKAGPCMRAFHRCIKGGG